ncbi:MAG: hypothetical protein HZA02_03675 [Nitrospinae bacterium]|nr:hypothetical protein [Nitrospinota bacterium]
MIFGLNHCKGFGFLAKPGSWIFNRPKPLKTEIFSSFRAFFYKGSFFKVDCSCYLSEIKKKSFTDIFVRLPANTVFTEKRENHFMVFFAKAAGGGERGVILQKKSASRRRRSFADRG